MKYVFFYAENGVKPTELNKVPLIEFATKEEAIQFIKDTSPEWQEIQPQSSFDIAAFSHNSTGRLLVLRQEL